MVIYVSWLNLTALVTILKYRLVKLESTNVS